MFPVVFATGCLDQTDPATASVPQVEALASATASDAGDASAMAEATPGSSVLDRGIGIVYFDRQPGSDTRGYADTLLVFRDTTGGRIRARYVLRGTATSWSYTLYDPDPVESSSLEFRYETEGLPVGWASADERWVRVIYGRNVDGTAREGWVKVTPGKARFTRWPLVLREQPLFFTDGVEPAFHGSARGTPVAFALADGGATPPGADYIMHPVQMQGDWMQVRVTTPSDRCASPSAPPVRQMVLWIRYLDDRGRPRVWYHTRGC